MSGHSLTCEEAIERLFDYLDRELDDLQATDIERHRHRCRDCLMHPEFEKRLRARVDCHEDPRLWVECVVGLPEVSV